VFLLAPTLMDLSRETLIEEVRARFGSELRRLGVFTQLCQVGAEACLEASATNGRLGVLFATAHGAATAARAALDDGLRRGEPAMPFTFIATQTNLAGALLARRSHDVARAACVYLAPQDWPWLLRMARSWLAQCERVAVGWVEEAAHGEPHRSHWCLLARGPVAGSIGCDPGTGGLEATTQDWIARIAQWRKKPQAALDLRGGSAAWRFDLHRGA
jgi:hypothetical protein